MGTCFTLCGRPGQGGYPICCLSAINRPVTRGCSLQRGCCRLRLAVEMLAHTMGDDPSMGYQHRSARGVALDKYLGAGLSHAWHLERSNSSRRILHCCTVLPYAVYSMPAGCARLAIISQYLVYVMRTARERSRLIASSRTHRRGPGSWMRTREQRTTREQVAIRSRTFM